MIIKIIIFTIIVLISSVILTSIFLLLIRRGFIAINELTPDVDEIKEMLRGNTAVADYFSRILSAFIIGMAIVLSCAVIVSITLIK
ncbi:MAG: hypothetical protein N2Z20_05070 [Elusimicrobiales bacterium]|nr:hypothetical protein [Elusimicrobiales bacterium]